MKSLFLVAITLSLHFLLGTCSISWSEYCGCLERAVTDLNTANVKNCFKGFFRGQQDVKDAIKTYKGKHTLCFAPSKDGDEECKVSNLSDTAITIIKRRWEGDLSILDQAIDHYNSCNVFCISYLYLLRSVDFVQKLFFKGTSFKRTINCNVSYENLLNAVADLDYVPTFQKDQKLP